ncbi:MAG: GNAT family N-acetyltransferase [Bacteroidota bacterium]
MPTIRKCILSDAPQLLQLARRTFMEAFEKDNNPDDFSQYLETAFTLPAIQAQLSNPDCFFFFVFIDSDLVGYFKLNKGPAQTDLRDDTAMELERIYLDAAYQGQGIGQWMVEQAVEIAKTAKKNAIWLGVWQKNSGAVRFYERFGFKKFGSHPYWIGNDKQTDWLYRLEF